MVEEKKCTPCEAAALIGVGIAICKVARNETDVSVSPCVDVVEKYRKKEISAKEAIKRLYEMAKEGKLTAKAKEVMEMAIEKVEG